MERPPRVLLVAEDPATRDRCVAALAGEGCDAVVAAGEPVDLALVEVGAGGEGLALVEALGGAGAGAPPVLALAPADAALRRRARAAGAADFAALPVDEVALGCRVRNLIELGRLRGSPAQMQLAAIVESATDAILSHSLDGVIATWNPGAERLFGYSAAEVIGRSIALLIPPERATEEADAVARILAGQRVEHYESVKLRKDGTRVEVALTVSPIPGAGGRIVGVSKIVHDVTGLHAAARQLARSEERLSLAIAAAGQGLWDWDLERDEAFLSPQYYQLTGYAEGEIRPDFSFFMGLVHPDDRVRVEHTMARHLRGETAQSVVEYRIRRKSGELRWVHGVGRVTARRSDGTPLRMIGVVTDVTERRQAEEALRASEERNRAMIAALPDMLFRIDRGLRFVDVAAADLSQLALPPERFLGCTIAEVFGGRFGEVDQAFADPRDFAGRLAAAVERALATGELQRFEYVFDGRWFEGRVVRANADEVLAIARDVNDLKRAEAALRQAIQSRDTVLAIVSHDLRSPLATVQLATERLRRRFSDDRDQMVAGHLDAVLRSSERMRRLIDDLLQAATIDAGTFSVSTAPAEVATIVDETLEALEPVAASRSARLERDLAPGLPAIRCDRQRVFQVLANLIGNAVKFAPVGGLVRVAARARGDAVEFSVADNGPGIAPAEAPRLFDRYWTGAGEGRPGVGLGLFISKGIVEAHGGRVWVESEPGAGATFYFTIPRA